MKKIRIAALTFFVLLLLSALAVGANAKWWDENPYTDVRSDAWYYDAVYYCADNRYFNGGTDGTYAPDGTMTRAMFAAVLYRMAGAPATADENPFADVENKAYYAAAVIWAAKEGIVNGYGQRKFGPNDPVTRAQAAAMLWRFRGRPAADPAALAPFADADRVGDWAAAPFAWAVGAGVIEGRETGLLDPDGIATRAEVAQIVMNYDTKHAE